MAISGFLGTAVSGLMANSARVARIADNIANVNTDGYKAGHLETSSLAAGGVQAVSRSPSGAPLFEGSGDVQSGSLEPSDVDIGREFADLILAENAYKASAKVLGVAEDLSQTLIGLKA